MNIALRIAVILFTLSVSINTSGLGQCAVIISRGGTQLTSVSGCKGSTYTLLPAVATGAGSYQWEMKATIAGSYANVTGATDSFLFPRASGYYRVLFTNSSCTAYSDSVEVKVGYLPALSITPPAPTGCLGSSGVRLYLPSSVYGQLDFSWYCNDTLVTHDTTCYATKAGNYYCIVSERNWSNCPDTSPSVAVISTAPAAPTVSSPVAFCHNVSATALSAVGSNLKWYTVANGGTGSSTAPLVSTSTIHSDTFYVSQTVGSCEGARARIISSVLPNPLTPVTANVTYCPGGTASALTATGTNLKWYSSAIGGSSTTTPPTPLTATSRTDTFYVSQTVNGCESPRANIIVSVAAPAMPVVANLTYCKGATANPLTAAGTNLLWYSSATGGSGASTAPTPTTTFAGTTLFYATQTVGGCESSRAMLSVLVNPVPAKPAVSAKSVCVCPGDTLFLSATSTLTTPHFRWTGPGSFSDTLGGTFRTGMILADSGLYLISVTDVLGCSSSDSVYVTVICPDSVWPGDVNYDKLVNNVDALEIALSMGSTGPVRAATSILWQPNYCAKWSVRLPGYGLINRKHADCDGDGVVSFNDTLAVTANYAMTHPRRIILPQAKVTGLPDLRFDVSGITAEAGKTIVIPVLLGRGTVPIEPMAGIAASIVVEGITPPVVPVMSYSGGWLGSANAMRFEMSAGTNRLDWVYARTDGRNSSGGGLFGYLILAIPPGSAGQQIKLYFDKVTIMNAEGVRITDFNTQGDSMIIGFPTAVPADPHHLTHSIVTPNPVTSELFLREAGNASYIISDMAGRVVQCGKLSASGRADVSSLATGIYIIRIIDAQQSVPVIRFAKQ